MEKDFFYLEVMFPEANKIFSVEYKKLNAIQGKCVYVLDTNVLLAPFDATKSTIEEIKKILINLKNQNKLFIPARVAREFANNRGKKISELFLKIIQAKSKLNNSQFYLDDYPLLVENENYKKVKKMYSEISLLIDKSRDELKEMEEDIKNWTWNDSVSKMYKEIFTEETIIEVNKTKEEIVENLKFRIANKIAPGYKDSGKIDEGIGDLIVWITILEIGIEHDTDIIFVTNEQKNDWFYKQDKLGLYPKYELFDEFRRFTNGKTIHIITFPKFLEIQNAKPQAIDEIQERVLPRNYVIANVIKKMLAVVKNLTDEYWITFEKEIIAYFVDRKTRLDLLASLAIKNQVPKAFFYARVSDEKKIFGSFLHSKVSISKERVGNIVKLAFDVYIHSIEL